MGSKFFDEPDSRIPKNMGGMIQPIDRTMMAVGGRVGFANGSPSPVEEDGNFKTSYGCS